MADDPKDPPAPPAPTAGLEDRVGKLETGQQDISGKLEQLIGMVGGGGKAPGEASPEGGGSVAAEIAAQLEQRDRERAAAKAAEDRDGRVAALEASVKDLAEKPPQPLTRRVHKVMGWADPR